MKVFCLSQRASSHTKLITCGEACVEFISLCQAESWSSGRTDQRPVLPSSRRSGIDHHKAGEVLMSRSEGPGWRTENNRAGKAGPKSRTRLARKLKLNSKLKKTGDAPGFPCFLVVCRKGAGLVSQWRETLPLLPINLSS